jgi:hypothetical protein
LECIDYKKIVDVDKVRRTGMPARSLPYRGFGEEKFGDWWGIARFSNRGREHTVVSGQINPLGLTTSQSYVDFFQNQQFDLFVLGP